jgi:O-antigen/teichoic acid export membrane protein/aminoglycoside phosphotransferase (APT) family kinase protein
MIVVERAGDAIGRFQRYARSTLAGPLLRNGLLLTLSSGSTALIGFVYWVVTARHYDPDSVGRNSAAISIMILLAATAQLDLTTVTVRFVPGAGRHTRRLVAAGYLISGTLAVLVSWCFVLLAPSVTPGVTYFDHPLASAAFIVATLAYTLFGVQDGVLTGLRRTAWVPVENVLFAVAKVGVVLLCARTMPEHGIFVSWLLPLVTAVVAVGVFLFGWAIPRHQRTDQGAHTLPPAPQIVRFVIAGYLGAVCSIASITLLPVLVIKFLGATANAGFAIAWIGAYSLHLVNINMGASLVVETTSNRGGLQHNCLEVLSHVGRLLVPAVTAVVICAPYLLAIFGPTYTEATGALRLLSLAAIPHLLVVTAISSARVQRRMGTVVLIQAGQCVVTLGLGWILLPVMGLSGVGLSWLLTQAGTAAVLLWRRDLWLTTTPISVAASSPERSQWSRLIIPLAILMIRTVDLLGLRDRVDAVRTWRVESHRRTELLDLLPALLDQVPAVPGQPPPSTWTGVVPVSTVTDLTVVLLRAPGHGPSAVLKRARTTRAACELCAQRVVLDRLTANPDLAAWRVLLPEVLLYREEGPHTLMVESYLAGTNLAAHLRRRSRQDDRADDSAVARSLNAIARLHRLTGRVELVTDDHLRRWVDEPLEQLHALCVLLAPARLGVVAELGHSLRESLRGSRMLVSWTHGDFTPGNVLIGPDGRINGIVDWGGARSGQPSVLDSYLMLLCTIGQREGRELGVTVDRLLRAGRLPSHERALLDASWVDTSPECPWDDIDEPGRILLAWLHHVAELRRKCDLYRENPVWWALNGEPVLQRIATMREVASK